MVTAAFEDTSRIETQKWKMLAKRKTELANMQERLLNAYIAGRVDEATYVSKSKGLRREAEDVDRQLDGTAVDPANADLALQVFDFSQNLVDVWRGSNFADRREILNCVSLNRTLDDVSLVMTKRKPFDVLAEGLQMTHTRGDWIRTSDLLLPKQAEIHAEKPKNPLFSRVYCTFSVFASNCKEPRF